VELVSYVNDVAQPVSQVLMTCDANGNYKAAYAYGLERIKVDFLDNSRPETQDPLYYLYDGLGSVSQLMTPSGNIRARYNYDPFGVPLTGGQLPADNKNVLYNSFGYTGEQHDHETDFIYLRARYYDPGVGRFISKDPWPGNPKKTQTLNPYPYVINNPMIFVDPLGLCPSEKSSLPLQDNWVAAGVKVVTKDGVQYYDLSIPVNGLIIKNAEEARKHRPIVIGSMADEVNITVAMLWFAGKVHSGGEWDIKLRYRWAEQLPNTPLVRESSGDFVKFAVFDQIVTSEDLGNITYGYWGTSMGFGPVTLYNGGGIAARGITDPETKSPPHYGDEESDHEMITQGINWYNGRYDNQKPLFNGLINGIL